MYFSKDKLMIMFLLTLFILLFFVLSAKQTYIVLAAQAPELSESAKAGKEIFDEVNCLMCHLLNGEGSGLDEKAPDLLGVSTRKNPDEMRQWLRTHLYEEPRISMFEEDPTDQDISNLVDYLQTL